MRCCYFVLFSLLFIRTIAQEPTLVLPLGHTSIVRTARFSPDNKFVITGSADKTAKVWETFSGKKIRDLGGNKSDVLYAFFSNDSRYIAVGTDSTVRIWSVPGNKLIREFDLIKKTIFSPDSKKAFLVDFKGAVIQFNLITQKNDFIYKDTVVNGVMDVSPDNRLLCIAKPSSLILREIKTGKLVAQRNTKGKALGCLFANDKRYLIMISDSGLQRFDLTRDVQPLNLIDWWSTSVFLNGDKRFALTATSDFNYTSHCGLWDFEKYKIVFNSDTVLSVYDSIPRFSPIDGSIDTVISGKLQYSARADFNRTPTQVSSTGRFIRIGQLLWNVFDNAASYLIRDNYIKVTDFSSDDRYLLTQQLEGTVCLWDVEEGKVVQEYNTRANNIRSIAITDDGKNFLVAGYDSTIKICETVTGRTINVLKGHKDLVRFASFNHRGDKVLTNSLDSTAKLWDVVSGKLLEQFKGQHAETNPAYFTTDDVLVLATVTRDTLAIPDLMNPEIVRDTSFVRFMPNPEDLANRNSRTGRYKFHIIRDEVNFMTDAFHENHLSVRGNFSIHAFSPDEKFVALADMGDDTLLIRDIEGNKWAFEGRLRTNLKNFNSKKGIEQLLFTSKYLLVVDENAVIHVLTFSGKQLFMLPGQKCAVSADSRYLLVANQGECDVYDFEKNKFLYSYISVDTANYLVIDSANRFDGSEAARKNLYYVCGTEIIDLEQIKSLSWEPDLVSKITGAVKQPITAKKLSEINICDYVPKGRSNGLKGGNYQFELTAQKGGIGEVQLFVNGKMIRKYDPGQLLKENNKYSLSVNAAEVDSFFVSGKENKVAVKATTREGNITSRGVDITRSSKKTAVVNPNMYILSVGIGKYKGEALQLKYASKDAMDFATALGNSAKKLLNTDGKEHVNAYIFNTDSGNLRWPTKKGIQKAVNDIRQFATADDIIVIFFAGHGILPAGKENLLLPTVEAESFSQVESLSREVAISFNELMQWLQQIKANKQLIILDVCNSGQAVKNLQDLISKREIPADQQRAIDNLTGATGSCVLAASAEGQPAYETSLYEQGLLTYSLLSGLKLGNGLRDNRYIQVNNWFDVATSNVQQMAKEIGGRQDPKKFGNASFDVGLVDSEVVKAIKLSLKKKVFRRSRLVLEGPIPSDNFGLTALVDKRLTTVSVRGKETLLTYIADNTLLNPYSIIGNYKITGSNVNVNVYLIRGDAEDKPVHEFRINGTIDKKEELAARIVDEVERFLKNE